MVAWYLDGRLINGSDFKRLVEAEAIVENSMITITRGIAGIGYVLAGVGGAPNGTIDKDILSTSALSDIGYLLEGLVNLAAQLDNK
ncbi:MAG: hypothetical protein ABW185_24115 [Sedimenticola sp.]